MSWERIESPTPAPGALGAHRADGFWVFRGIASVFACTPGKTRPRWQKDFGDETMSIGPKAVGPRGGGPGHAVGGRGRRVVQGGGAEPGEGRQGVGDAPAGEPRCLRPRHAR